jgi:hypothetical protein
MDSFEYLVGHLREETINHAEPLPIPTSAHMMLNIPSSVLPHTVVFSNKTLHGKQG